MAVLRVALLFTAVAGAAAIRVKKTNATKANATLLPFDCYLGSDKGVDYVGLADSTKSGRTCKNWLDQGKYSATISGVGNHHYCRNPEGSKSKPWCFTVDSNVEWEFCEVPECPADGAPPEPWVAPKGAKSDSAHADGPCEHTPPQDPGYEEFKAERACMNNRGDKWWLITNKMVETDDAEGCKNHCDTLPGSSFFTFFGTKNKDDENCGCYRECILVPADITVNGPTVYRMTG